MVPEATVQGRRGGRRWALVGDVFGVHSLTTAKYSEVTSTTYSFLTHFLKLVKRTQWHVLVFTYFFNFKKHIIRKYVNVNR